MLEILKAKCPFLRHGIFLENVCTFDSRVYQMTIYTERRVAHRRQSAWEIPTKEEPWRAKV